MLPSFLFLALSTPTKGTLFGPATKVESLSVVAPGWIKLNIDEGSIDKLKPTRYISEVGDRIEETRDKDGFLIGRILTRENRKLGWVTGTESKYLIPFRRFSSTSQVNKIDLADLQSPSRFTLKVGILSLRPERVTVQTTPLESEDSEGMGTQPVREALRHSVYLKFGPQLIDQKPGVWTLEFENLGLTDRSARLIFDDRAMISPSVHVNPMGFIAEDTLKQARITAKAPTRATPWTELPKFEVLNTRTGEVALSGTAELQKEDPQTSEPTYVCKFPSLKTPGIYRVVVKGLGSSTDFPIGINLEPHFQTILRGFLQLRATYALSDLYTKAPRPAGLDSRESAKNRIVVRRSPLKWVDLPGGLHLLQDKSPTPAEIAQSATGEPIANAYGGYSEGPDSQRRIQSLIATSNLLDVYLQSPSFGKISLKTPEVLSKWPDLLMEAAWNVDCFRRLQGDPLPSNASSSGGIPGAIFPKGPPIAGERSWEDSREWIVPAPDFWSSYIYVRATAKLAQALKSVDAPEWQDYTASALRAMVWAERDFDQWLKKQKQPDDPLLALSLRRIRADQAMAAVELWKVDPQPRWLEVTRIHLNTLSKKDLSPAETDSLFFATTLSKSQPNLTGSSEQQKIAYQARERLMIEANRLHDLIVENPWRSQKRGDSHKQNLQQAMLLGQAYRLSQQPQFRDAAWLSLSPVLGFNPANLSFVSGFPLAHDLQTTTRDGFWGRTAPVNGLVGGNDLLESQFGLPLEEGNGPLAYILGLLSAEKGQKS